MGHKTLIDGVGYEITGGRCLDDGVGYSIQKGRTLIDGVGYDVGFGVSGTPAAEFAVGQSLYANVDGVRTEFIIVHQGIPSTTEYDASCEGTWLLMKDVYENRAWHSSNSNKYADSTIHAYLNGTFAGLFDSKVKNRIKSVKIPYINGTGSGGSVAKGANGLAAQFFLLSCNEVKYTTSDYKTNGGSVLDYFNVNVPKALRKAYLNGTGNAWHLRSPSKSNTASACAITATGDERIVSCTTVYGIRPAFILDSSAVVNPDTFDILG